MMFLLATLGCGDPAETPVVDTPANLPDLFCPGDPSGDCEAQPGMPLMAGAAVRSVIPACFETWTDSNDNAEYEASRDTFLDCGCDRLCPGDEGYVEPDAGEGDGVFQASWIAGFQNGRAASGVRDASLGLRGEGDGLWARAIVLSQGQTTLAIVAVDAIGIMYGDTLSIRAAVRDAGHDVDHVVIHATHDHEAPDLMGIWGPSVVESGYDVSYARQVEEAVVEAIGDAVSQLTEVEVAIGQADARDYWDNGVANLIRDSRDPFIVDPMVGAARFFKPDTDETVATMVHWANHPETVAQRNTLFTSDYAHALRETVESGVAWSDGETRPGVGGVCVFVNGAVGGMMTSLGAEVVDPTGVARRDASFEKADAVGQLVGEMALDALADAAPIEPTLWFGVQELFLPIDNIAFQAMFLIDVFSDRTLYNYDPDKKLDATNVPDVRTEVDLIGIGPWRLLTLPGEPLPELVIGGYDGAFTPEQVDLIDPDNSLPPDLSAAPMGPFIAERMDAEHTWVLGLGNDELGYIIPEYNFVVADPGAYLFEAGGDHYEETNSLGPNTAALLDEAIDKLTTWAASSEGAP
jgi:hypothetical protein